MDKFTKCKTADGLLAWGTGELCEDVSGSLWRWCRSTWRLNLALVLHETILIHLDSYRRRLEFCDVPRYPVVGWNQQTRCGCSHYLLYQFSGYRELYLFSESCVAAVFEINKKNFLSKRFFEANMDHFIKIVLSFNECNFINWQMTSPLTAPT